MIDFRVMVKYMIYKRIFFLLVCLISFGWAGAQITPVFNTTGQSIETNYLTWNPFSGASQYQIYWSTSPGVTLASTMISIPNASILGYFHTGLTGGQTYYYRIRALDAFSNWTLLSDEIAVVVLAQFAQNMPGGNGDGHAMEKTCVTNLNGLVFNPNYNELTVYQSFETNQIHWQAYSGATSYLLQFTLDTNSTWTTLQNNLNTSFIHTGLTGNTNYFYRLIPQLSGTCVVNPNASLSAVALPLHGYFNGGNADGHSNAGNCRSKLDGTDDPPITAEPIVYAGFLENNIFWQATSGAINYTLEFSTSINGTYSVLAAATTLLNFNHSGLIAGQEYYYRVRANFATGCPFGFSSPILGIPFQLISIAAGGVGDGHDSFRTCPIKLDGTSAAANSQSITVYASTEQNLICWPQEPGAVNYTLEVSTNISGPYSLLTTTNLLQFAHVPASLVPETAYYYRVTANLTSGCPLNPSVPFVNTAFPQYQIYGGGVADGHANMVTCVIKLNGSSAAPVSQPITVYSSIEQNLICWPQESGASGYILEVATNSSGPFTQIYSGSLLNFAHVPSGLTPEVEYFYRVTATLPSGCPLNPSLVQSAIARAQNYFYSGGVADGHANEKTCLVKLSGLPDAPQSQAITVYSSVEQIFIAWPSEAGASSYLLEYSNDGISNWIPILNSNVTTFLDVISPGGVTRYYRVTAFLNNGCSLQPSVVSIGNSIPNYQMYPGGVADGHANARSCTFVRLDQSTITSQGTTTFCQGGSVTLSASVAVLYAWYLNGVAIPYADSSSYVATQSGSYTVDVFNIYSCNATSMTMNVVVNSAPPAPGGVTANPSGFSCGPVTLTTDAAPSGIQYYWQGNNPSGTSTSMPASNPYFATSTGNYYVSAIDTSTGCWSVNNTMTSVTVAAYPSEITPTTNPHLCNLPGPANWIHITAPDDRIIASVNPGSQNLGFISADVFVSTAMSNQFDGSNEFLRRHFVINPQYQPSGNVLVRLYFSNADLSSLIAASQASATPYDNVNSIADLVVTKYQGPTEDGFYDISDAIQQMMIIPNSFGTDFLGNFLEFEVNGFSEFWIHGMNINPLPVSWLYADVECIDGKKNIKWATLSETNNAEFQIFKSIDLIDWTFVARLNGAGNSNTPLFYNYIYNDLDVLSYFKLKQIDYNGQSSYAEIIAGNCELLLNAFDFVGVYVNESVIHLKFNGISNDFFRLNLYDSAGKLIYQNSNLLQNANTISLPFYLKLASGIYHVQVINAEGKSKSIKCVF